MTYRFQCDECELSEENEQLKQSVSKWQKSSAYWSKTHSELEKENEQLKKDIEYYKIERLALFEYLEKDDLKLELKVEK